MDIIFNHIVKKYEDKTVLDDITISFLEGKMNCLMGPSGSGKTTVINLIMGLIKPNSGEIIGCNNKKIAAVFQENRLIEHWDACKNITLVCDKSVTKEEVIRELNKVGIVDCEKKAVQDFSGGMKRRVALVRAILAQSDLLIMDEPFKGLDEAMKHQVIEYVKQNVQGKTVIVVTHDKEEASQLEANTVYLA